MADGKYDDVPGGGWGDMWFGDPGNPGGGGGGGGSTGGFIPTFSGMGGQASPFGGFASSPVPGIGGVRRRLPMPGQPPRGPFTGNAGSMGGVQMGGRRAGYFGSPIGGPATGGGGGNQIGGPATGRWLPGLGWVGGSSGPPNPPPDPSADPWSQGWNPAWGIWSLLQNAGRGGDPNFGGAFSLNPPSAIMAGIRGQAVQDAGARERAARLGLQARGDVDPSTYGFQALQSQLRGQQDTARTMSAADLGLRQQQLQNYWQMLNALLREASQSDRAKLGGDPGTDWGSIIGGVGSVIGAIPWKAGPSGGGSYGSTMGQPDFRYPYYGG